VNKILMDAIKNKASDIHFEPYEKMYRVRYRQDGILYEVATPPIKLANSIVARLKVMANLDIAERRVPQDGRFKLILGKDRNIDFRISTLPTLHGEKVVMRILDPTATQLDIVTLGFDPQQQEYYLNAINKSQGIILVTGPTGSGKTVSLYTALRILNRPEKNISTIEDPVEIYMEGINQVQVNLKSGMTFSKALRAFLRQDPDIMMVGEIRDLETAEIAIKAAQTGHLVLSTLHTNSAPETLDRLRNIGIQTYNLASSVLLVMAQRLARRLCQVCKRPEKISEITLTTAGFSPEECAGIQFYGPGGCDQCTLGYKGRVGIYEVMPISPDMQRIIINNGNTLDLRAQMIKEGIKTLSQSGIEKIRQGLTSFEEVNRVVSR
jgi:type IV pilus assembly protein PilB